MWHSAVAMDPCHLNLLLWDESEMKMKVAVPVPATIQNCYSTTRHTAHKQQLVRHYVQTRQTFISSVGLLVESSVNI